MRKKIQQALEANDIPQVREILIEAITSRAGNARTLTDIAETIESTPGLFEPDDGCIYPKAHDMTESLIETLKNDIRANFSLPKYRLLTEVSARIARDPSFKLKKEPVVTDEAIFIAGAPVETEVGLPKRHHTARTLGYILILAGLAAAITAICIPLHFLIGVGIGVMMLGIVLVYLSLPHAHHPRHSSL